MSFGKNHGSTNQTQNQHFNGTDNTTFNQTSTPNNPAWVDATAQMLNGGIGALSGQDPRSFIAGADPLQTQAGTSASGLGAGATHAFDSAAGTTGYVMNANAPHTGAVQASPYIQSYMDPYQNDVINAADADLSHTEGLTHAQDALNLAKSGAFGGSGAALTQAADNEQLGRVRASTLSGLRSAGFTQAVGAAQQDANRKQGANDLNAQLYGQNMDRSLGAAQQLAGLQTARDANQRANITTQAGLGDALRQIQQQYAQSPIDFQNALTQLFASLPTSLFHGETDNGTQNDVQSGTTTGTTNGNSSGFGFGFTQK